ncbi:hypothetical protein MEQU1_001415 [Malassezia equina]|uniref:Cation-transporting ATPase n=1 Tax=Malassezia equina TaxID=1381935 RepID=A0AAF0ED06_9BASI|nr:hypothetical protein MEQU1_001415 [Malassezia equina]
MGVPGGTSREPPMELADEQYQAPFTNKMSRANSDAQVSLAPSSVSSSFFDEQELRDAEAYLHEAAQDSDHDAAPVSTRRRRHSQIGSYDDRNTIFDGPAAEFVPSSVSSMHHFMARPSFPSYSRSKRRHSLSRISRGRLSGTSAPSHGRLSRDPSPSSAHTHESGLSPPASVISYRKRTYPRPMTRRSEHAMQDAPPTSSSLIGSLFSGFRADHGDEADEPPRLSVDDAEHRSWSEDGSDLLDETAVDDDDMEDPFLDDTSDRSSRSSGQGRSPTHHFVPNFFDADPFPEDSAEGLDEGAAMPFDDPALPPKPVHLGDYPGLTESLLEENNEAPAGPPGTAEEPHRYSVWLDKTCRSKQQIYLMDEDTLIRVSGYRTRPGRYMVFIVACVLSLGVLGLLSLWFPRWRLRYVSQSTDFADAEFVVVENQYGDVSQESFLSVPFARPLNSVFPPSSRDPPCTHAQAQAMMHGELSDDAPEPEAETMVDLILFEYRYRRFILHPPTGRFRTIQDWRDAAWVSTHAMRQGIKSDLERERQVFFGLNVIEIAGKSTMELLVGEVLHPFYMFQIVSIVLWSLDDYYYYAFCIAAMSVGSIISTLVETKKTIARMREMNRFVCTVRVLRDGMWVWADSSELVPGDVYDASDAGLSVLPADSVLLSGDAIVNESMLTGESVPISKQPLDERVVQTLQTTHSDLAAHLAKHFLFAGTKVIRIRPVMGGSGTDESVAKAMVVRTGFNTTKGSLVRGMLFPKPMGFKFYRDSFRFIGFLGCIALIGLCFNTVKFVQLGIAWSTLIIRVLDLVTVVVPPALPATMSIGTAFAIARLRQRGVFCISPTRVNMGGKVNVVCFDKTGTLTEDGLDVLGARTVDPTTGQFSELHQTVDEIPAAGHGPLPLLHALTTCHNLKVVDGEVIGDPLDVKMFEYTRWRIDEGEGLDAVHSSHGGERPPALVQTVVRPPGGPAFDAEQTYDEPPPFLELGVIRTFEFVSSLRRMSVVVKQLHSSSMEIFVKGAPEALADICDRASLPADFDDLLSYYTQHGYRVIACAGKSLAGMGWVEAQRMARSEAESDLQFLGLIVFENKLKAGSAPAIATLRHAHIGCKMVTGDNPRTAVSVARECGILGPSTTVFLPTFVHGSPEQPTDVLLAWTSTDDEAVQLNPDTLKPLHPDPMNVELFDYELAITGDVFRWMTDYAPIELVRRMLIKGVIFARMSPDEKHDLVNRLQELGYTVGMCGDGANDCGALKAADMGISLSEAEASVAAPFTSTRPDISCVIEVMKEGRAALVTSFSCFKYMALYSLIQFTSITILYNLASSLGDFQFLYIDLFMILPVAVAMARTRPYPTLHTKRPTANLVSKKVLLSMLGQVVICSLFQALTFWLTQRQPWYEPPPVNPDELNVVNAENSALFLVSSFQYLTVAAVFSVGPPFRQPMYTNPMLMASLTLLSLFSLFFLFVRSGFFFDLMGLVHFPPMFHWQLLAIVVLNTAACFVFESYLMMPTLHLIKWLQRLSRGRRHDKLRKPHQKTYKAVLLSMNDPAVA